MEAQVATNHAVPSRAGCWCGDPKDLPTEAFSGLVCQHNAGSSLPGLAIFLLQSSAIPVCLTPEEMGFEGFTYVRQQQGEEAGGSTSWPHTKWGPLPCAAWVASTQVLSATGPFLWAHKRCFKQCAGSQPLRHRRTHLKSCLGPKFFLGFVEERLACQGRNKGKQQYVLGFSLRSRLPLLCQKSIAMIQPPCPIAWVGPESFPRAGQVLVPDSQCTSIKAKLCFLQL